MSPTPEAYRFDVAISFAGDGKRDQVRAVAERLRRELGHGKVFFDEWFEAELAGHDAQIVLQNIYGKQTRLVVTCICARYNEKPWTHEEWRAIQAFERTLRDAGSANKKRLRFLPLRFSDGEIDGLFETAIAPDVRNRTPDQIADLILERLRLTPPDGKQVPVQSRAVTTNLPPRNEHFRGRVSELEELHQLLNAEGRIGVTQRVAAWAHGGVGKTTLALEYGWQHLQDYPGGVFIVSADTAVIEPGLATLAKDFDHDVTERLRGKDQSETAENVRRHLTRGARALLILDNVRDAEQLRGWKASLPGQSCRLLMTTRSTRLPEIKMWPLERLSDDDAIEVLASHRPDAADTAQRASVDVAIRACDGLAVAVVAVGAYLALNEHLSWKDYANDLRRKGEAVVDQTLQSNAEASGYTASLDAIFSDLFESLGKAQQRCLQFASLLPPDQVPRPWIQALLEAEPQLELKALPGEALPAVGVVESLLRLQILRVSDEEGRLLTVHRLLGYWVRKTLDDSWKEKIVEQLIRFAEKRAQATAEALTDSAVRWELRPLSALCQLLVESGLTEPAMSTALRVSKRFLELGRYGEARVLLESVVSSIHSEHPKALTARLNLAATLYAQGDLAGARDHEQIVLDARQRMLGDDHADTLTARLNLASTLYAQGDLVRARGHQEAVMEAQRRLLGDEHADTLTARNNLAGTLYAQGELAAAYDHQQAVLEGMRRLRGDEHPHTLTARNNLAQTLYVHGDLAGAREHQEAVLEVRRRVLGDEHPDTLVARSNLAHTLQAQGDHEVAFGHMRSVLEAMSLLLGDEHPDTLTARNNLGVMLYQQGDLAGARRQLESALESRRRVQGAEHPLTISTLDNLTMIGETEQLRSGAHGQELATVESDEPST